MSRQVVIFRRNDNATNQAKKEVRQRYNFKDLRFFIRDFFAFLQEESGCTDSGIDIRIRNFPQA